METKFNNLINQIKRAGVDAALIMMPENLRYYSSFTGSSGWLLIHSKARYLITDFRYIEQGKKQCPDYIIIDAPGQKAFEFIKEASSKLCIAKVWFEEEYITYKSYIQLSEALTEIELVPSKGILSENRIIKYPKEIKCIRKAAAIADKGFSHIVNFIKPGRTEKEIALELEIFLKQNGSEGLSFDIIAASGINSALPHAQPSDKAIEYGDFVVLDFGCIIGGYRSDMTRTVSVGKPHPKLREIYSIVLDAQLKALEGLKPGITGFEGDKLSRDYIIQNGYGDYFGHGLGHGVGLKTHERPTLSPRGTDTLKSGMVVTVEPGIYLPRLGGVRIEDLVVITEKGVENLTSSSKDLLCL
jgi:Xaa-Pro aminopeptidase